MVCPECAVKPGMYYGCLLVPGNNSGILKCPNCKTVLVPIRKAK